VTELLLVAAYLAQRAYATEKLDESGESEVTARRHAEYNMGLFEQAEAEWGARPTAEWLGDYGRQIDNLRAALDWAFSPGGDASIGVAPAAAAVPLWMHLSLMEACRVRVERALDAIDAGTGRDAHQEMRLHAALSRRGRTPLQRRAGTWLRQRTNASRWFSGSVTPSQPARSVRRWDGQSDNLS
jgi:hypothetical protein